MAHYLYDSFNFDALCANEDLSGLREAHAELAAKGRSEHLTLLMHCASASPKVLSLLIELGEDPLKKGAGGYTALHTAATYGYLESIKFFVACGIPVNALTDHASTPLMGACTVDERNVAAVELLLSLKANPNPIFPGNRGPLHLLPLGRNWEHELVAPLVRAGARVDQRLPNGASPLTLALEMSSKKSDGQPNTRLAHALMQNGARFDPRSGQREDAAIHAADQDNGDLLRALHSDGLDLSAIRTDEGKSRTLMHLAFMANATSSVMALLDAGADPEALDANNKKPMSYAKKSSECAMVLQSFRAKREAQKALSEIAGDFTVASIKPEGVRP